MGKRKAAAPKKAPAPKKAAKKAQSPKAKAEAPAKPERSLRRHDTEEAADRAIKKRLLPKFSESKVSGAVNAAGQSVVDVVMAKVRENRPLKKNLVSAFWVEVVNEFKLRSDTVDSLPQPDGKDSLGKDLLEVVAWAHASNPSDRTTKPLERHLEGCDALNYGELHWLVGCCQESPEIVASASSRMFMALTSYCARRSWVGPNPPRSDWWRPQEVLLVVVLLGPSKGLRKGPTGPRYGSKKAPNLTNI